jgi:hypothetical protein
MLVGAAVSGSASAGEIGSTRFVRQPPPPSLRSDLGGTPARLWRNLQGLPTRDNAQLLGLGAGWALLASEGWDRPVRRGVARRPERMGGANDVLSISGNPAAHVGAAGLLYATSLLSGDRRLHAFTLDLADALMLTDVSNQALKYSFDRDRPNGDRYGFPSGHSASSFALAAVVQKHYGLVPGLLAYSAAGAVGWHRIDARKHELSDVLGGAAIGYLVGRTVTGDESFPGGNWQIVPYSDPVAGGAGIGIRFSF